MSFQITLIPIGWGIQRKLGKNSDFVIREYSGRIWGTGCNNHAPTQGKCDDFCLYACFLLVIVLWCYSKVVTFLLFSLVKGEWSTSLVLRNIA